MSRSRIVAKGLKPAIFIASLVPFALLIWNGFTDGLGANPVEAIARETGEWGLIFLLVTLAVTPVRRLTGWVSLTRTRRMLGLFSFFYLCLHFLTYVWLDAYFDLAYIVEDVLDRLYITAGFSGFLLMIPLAATSTDSMVRRIGPRRWRALHRIVYGAGIAGVLHYLWLVKADLREPLLYASVLTLLLVARLPGVAGRIRPLRHWWRAAEPSRTAS